MHDADTSPMIKDIFPPRKVQEFHSCAHHFAVPKSQVQNKYSNGKETLKQQSPFCFNGQETGSVVLHTERSWTSLPRAPEHMGHSTRLLGNIFCQ